MSRLQERKKQRREYLKQKGKALAILTLIVVSFGSMVWFASASLSFFWVGVFLVVGWMTFRDAREKASRIPFVAPVTSDTLPAEEVLVRGSEEPAQAQKEVLVRPASWEEETKAQELLRSSGKE